jgi:phosphohistidine swiveling domain-containing protein
MGQRTYGKCDVDGIITSSKTKANTYIRKGKPFFWLKCMTEPEEMPIMCKAAAIITLQGGPTCHAAIVCATMGINCLTSVAKIYGSKSKYTLTSEHIPIEGLMGHISENILTIEVPNDHH